MQAAQNLMEECPTCGTPVHRMKFNEIQAKLRQEEEQRARRAKVESDRLLAEGQKKLAADRVALDEAAKLQHAALVAAQATVEKLKAEQAAQTALAKKTTEESIAKAIKERDTEAAKTAQAALVKQKEVLNESHKKEMLQRDANARREHEATLKKVADLEKQLAASTLSAEGAEIDVLEALKAEFDPKGDTFRKADDIIRHSVFHRRVACGTIIVRSQNSGRWFDAHATKLREHAVEVEADYAVLATTTFPKEAAELTVRSEVLLVSPARVVALVRILRKALVQLHQARVSNEERAEKKAHLYEFITSPACREKFTEGARLTKNLQQIDVEETQAHRLVWEKRGKMVKSMEKLIADLDSEINDIVSGK